MLAIPAARADGSAFDLVGPKVDVHVKRGDVTLPISQVSNLLPGDRLWIHPDLPPSQSEHFVLVVGFLRGSTNPPPPGWFTRVEAWAPKIHAEGVFVTVPAGAEQALLFLVPETGGDFNTLRKTVHDEPGSFVRAVQDLEAASSERLRLDAYLADVQTTSKTNPDALKPRTEMAARSLGIKINESCFLKPASQQVSCLSQNSEGMVLDSSSQQGLVSQLASGNALDLVNELSYSSVGGAGVYSAYVGAVVDTAKILSSLHTAHFQYIPALALPTADTLNLRLNMPPSFRSPKSVVVIALPAIGPAHPEALYAVKPSDSYCALKPSLVLPAEGAPLVFATPLAHDLYLRVQPGAKAKPIDIPVKADPTRGGLVLSAAPPALPAGPFTAELRGKWGFNDWVGPEFHLYAPEPDKWAVAPGDQSALVVGREDTLHLTGESSLCVQKIEERSGSGAAVPLSWTSAKPDTVEVKLPLKDTPPGTVVLTVAEYGLAKPDRITVIAYQSAASLSGLTLAARDTTALLKGTRLDEVANARLGGIAFKPGKLTRAGDLDQLELEAAGSTASLEPGKAYTAQVTLRDGRHLTADVTVLPPRPQVALLTKGVQYSGASVSIGLNSHAPIPVQLGSPDDLPVDGRLVFFLKSTIPATFPRDETIEVAADDSSFHTTLSFSDGSLLLEDSATAEASFQPVARFGLSAFGAIRLRPIAADGQTGDWIPLGTLVRLPVFRNLRCPRSRVRPCILSATNLFLAAAVSTTPQFDSPVQIPPEFTGDELIVPHPVNGTLYVRLRDDTATVQTLVLPVTEIAPREIVAPYPITQPQPEPAPPTAAPAAKSTPPGPAPTAAPKTPATQPASQTSAPQSEPSTSAKPAPATPTPRPAPSTPPAASPTTPAPAPSSASPQL